MTRNLICILTNHKWKVPPSKVREVDGVMEQLMAVCERDNCDAKVWEVLRDGPDV